MNFKFTKNKTITSIIIGIILFIIVIIVLGSTCIGSCPSFNTQIRELMVLPLTFIFWFAFLQTFAMGFILIYIIWSLIEKK